MAWNKKLLDYLGAVYVTNGPLSLYRRKYVLKVGGFDRKSITEDIDITWNMLYHGFKTALCLDARVSTIAPKKFKLWFRQRARWGIGGLQAIGKYRKMFFRKGVFGYFILPYVSFSIIFSIITFLFSVYLLLKFLMVRYLTINYSLSTDSTIFSLQDINFYPSVIIFYFLVMFICSINYSAYILRNVKFGNIFKTTKFFNLMFYVFVYASIFRFIRGDYRW